MKYKKVVKGLFLERPNRFIARVSIDGEEQICHVKNTGRCRELLLPGKTFVYLEDHEGTAGRKTRYSVIAVEKGDKLINMDSQAPNKAAGEWIGAGGLFPDVDLVKGEKAYGNSRLDFYVEAGGKKIFLEVKGVTLEENGCASFPDAPTERGIRHIEELCRCKAFGYEAYLLFVIQMKGVFLFRPNDKTHPAFGEALRKAEAAGVSILAVDCLVKPGSITIDQPVLIDLG